VNRHTVQSLVSTGVNRVTVQCLVRTCVNRVSVQWLVSTGVNRVTVQSLVSTNVNRVTVQTLVSIGVNRVTVLCLVSIGVNRVTVLCLWALVWTGSAYRIWRVLSVNRVIVEYSVWVSTRVSEQVVLKTGRPSPTGPEENHKRLQPLLISTKFGRTSITPCRQDYIQWRFKGT
jgi:hypothetical protein